MRSIKEMDKRLDEREKEIERLQKENKKLKLCLGILSPSRVLLEGKYWEKEDNREIERLNSIINELEEWLEKEQVNSVDLDEWTIIQVRDKIVELKGSDSNGR